MTFYFFSIDKESTSSDA